MKRLGKEESEKTKVVRCGNRKEESCKTLNICEWKDNKCKTKKEETDKTKVVQCGNRKEESCKTLKICEWKDNKCKTKKEEVQCENRNEVRCMDVESCKWVNQKCVPRVKPVSKISCPRKKEKGCKNEPLCVWADNKCANKVTSPKLKASFPPAPKENLQNMENRHCMYYLDDDIDIEIEETVNMQSKRKLRYDPLFKAPYNVNLEKRKLILSEIQMLTKYYKSRSQNRKAIVLYAGAARTHLILLSIMFPNISFILFDGAKFDPILKKYPIPVYEIHEGVVTTDVIKEIKTKLSSTKLDLLFISDIRLESEDHVDRDMSLQEEWMEILKPKMSLLKFRMSYNMKHGDKFKYTKGDILFGIWPKSLSGETRLLVHQEDIGTKINYDFKTYEEIMFYHNKYDRSLCYPISELKMYSMINSPNNMYCPCFDCMSELNVLNLYSKVMRKSFGYTILKFNDYMKNVRFNKSRNLEYFLHKR